MIHTVHCPSEFRNAVLQELGFSPKSYPFYTLYQNEKKRENGHYLLFERPNYYDFGIADYSIDHPFAIEFQNEDLCMRFGIVYEGTTKFQLQNQPVSSFSPSSFFVIEKNIIGKQVWKRGQHFHGMEISIYPAYFEEVIKPLFPLDFFSNFEENYTYHYLPLEIHTVFHRLLKLAETDQLNPLHLESALLQCIAILAQNIQHSNENAFANQRYYEKILIGSNRSLSFHAEDIRSIQKAHDILLNNIANPPTIEMLSKELLISTQKLKAGFSHFYHMTIGEFSTSLKMSTSATLLCTTDLSVAEIAKQVGYTYPSNFIKKFQQTYSCTPLKYRERERNS